MSEDQINNDDLQRLTTFLKNNSIPELEYLDNKTFITQVWTGNQEKFISDLYAFFFKPDEIHGFRDLFLQALLNLININIEIDIFNVIVEREVSIPEPKGRIDILITSADSAIIIENKILANVHNVLENYYSQIKQKNKVIVLLTPNPENVDRYRKNLQIVNITHSQLCKSVLNLLGDYQLEAEPFYILLLQQLCKTINSLEKMKDKKVLKFYFDNKEQLQKINFILEHEENYIKEEIKNIPQILNRTLKVAGPYKKHFFYLKSDRVPNLMLTIVFLENIINFNSYLIIIEFQKDLVAKCEEFKNKFSHNFKNFHYITNKYKEIWCHFAVRSYELDFDTFLNLGQTIANNIKEDGFLELFEAIENQLLE